MALTEAEDVVYCDGANRAAVRVAKLALAEVVEDCGNFTPAQQRAVRHARLLLQEVAIGEMSDSELERLISRPS